MSAKHVNDANFDSEVLQSDVPVLVDFWAPSCGPCRAMGPAVDALADQYAGRAKVVKVNVYEAPEAAARYRVTSIPYFVVFQNGQATSQLVGMRQPHELSQVLDAAQTSAA